MKSKNIALILLLTAMCAMTACSSSETNDKGSAGTTTNGTTTNGAATETPNTGTNGTDVGVANSPTLTDYKYEDGTYRGSYVDNDVNQISVEFVLKDSKFESIKYRALSYKGGNYLDEAATGVLKAVREQYQQAADALIGKSIADINMLYTPADIVKDVDTVTGATLRTGKLVSAIWDGLNRHPYKLAE